MSLARVWKKNRLRSEAKADGSSCTLLWPLQKKNPFFSEVVLLCCLVFGMNPDSDFLKETYP